MGFRRFAVVVGVVFAVASFAVPEAGAAKPPVNGRGRVECTVAGKANFVPAIQVAQQQVSAVFKGNLACSIGATGTAVRVIGGKFYASASYVAECVSPNPDTLVASIKWKSTGGKVAPTGIAFQPVFDQNGRTAVYNGGVVTGSYVGVPPELTLTYARCGPKGLKRSSFNGRLSLNPCTANVRTVIQPGQTEDGHIWWVVVAPECGYTPANHPTGTISWAYDRPDNLPQCTGTNVPIQRVWPTDVYWGAHTNINLGALEMCFGRMTVFRYSGDARFRPYSL